MADGREINWVEEAERARAVAEQELAHLYMPPRYQGPGRAHGSADLMRTNLTNDCGADPWVQGLTDLDDPTKWQPANTSNPFAVKYLAPHLRRHGEPYTSDGILWKEAA